MKTSAHIKNGTVTMKRLQALPLLLGLFFASAAGVVNAQSAGDKGGASPTRVQIKMERDEFLKTHQWDAAAENWTLKSGSEAPAGMKGRAEIKAERDEFLRNNRWDGGTQTWVSLKGQPRDLGTMTREQVRAETREFVRTHRWDEANGTWVEHAAGKKRK